VHVALWLVTLHYAVFSLPGEGQWWVRVTSAVGAFLPAHLWVIKESITLSSEPWKKLLRGIWPWALICVLLAGLTPIEGFVAKESSRESHGFGWAYYTYIVGIIGVYVALSRQTLRQSREQGGGIRLELQIALIGGSISAGSVLLLMALRAILALPWLIFLQPLVVLVCTVGDKPAVRQLQLHRMHAATVVEGSLVVPEGFDLDRHLREGHLGFRLADGLLSLRVRIARDAAQTYEELAISADQQLERQPDGSAILRATVPDTLELRGWIQGYASKFEVLEPASLREAIAEELRAAAARYASPVEDSKTHETGKK
jgi:hypothetical protein